ncbi:2Fe-2S iron-sulfur cluster-binding protein [Rhodoblastus sp.]|uniref:2Fe-2S iron-sulfur cluster-binding protein n=1 Tax=Rhodoblastus sp. TaxID=1962975 RepID=UPI003F97523B
MPGEKFTITLEGHGVTFGFSYERVLVALERAQGFGQLKDLPFRLPVGCRRGGCGVCRMRVTSGSFHADPMSRAHVSVEEEASGLVLACCIYPRSELSLRLETPAAVKEKCRKAAKVA